MKNHAKKSQDPSYVGQDVIDEFPQVPSNIIKDVVVNYLQ